MRPPALLRSCRPFSCLEPPRLRSPAIFSEIACLPCSSPVSCYPRDVCRHRYLVLLLSCPMFSCVATSRSMCSVALLSCLLSPDLLSPVPGPLYSSSRSPVPCVPRSSLLVRCLKSPVSCPPVSCYSVQTLMSPVSGSSVSCSSPARFSCVLLHYFALFCVRLS